jgi:WD40 repeat protein
VALALEVDRLCQRFEKAWQTMDRRPRLEEYLAEASAAARPELLHELLGLELDYRRRLGETLVIEEFLARFPRDSRTVGAVFGEIATRGQGALHVPALAVLNQTADKQPGETAEATLSGTRPPLPVVAGYEVLGVLGRGGMGIVYRARQVKLNRLVALKMIKAGTDADEAELVRFRTEAEAVARLQHPHIVQIFEVGEHQGLPFFSLEYCPGGTLAARLAGTPLAAVEAARLVATLAGAVQAAHEQGVIHRDLNPANVLLAEDGTPKITDFGLAKKLDEAGQTTSGAVLGTPSYMAPEQAGGQMQEIGPGADVYALGALLYECLTGRPPFRAATALETLVQVRADDPVPPRHLQPKIPRDLETICLKCLHKEPGRRYASALDLAEDLRRFTAGEPIHARPVGPGECVVKWVKRRPVVAALLGVVVLLTAAGLGGIAWAYGEVLRERNNAQAQAGNALKAEAATRKQKEAAEKAEADALQQKEAAQKAERAAQAQTKETLRALANSQVMLADAAWREGHAALAQDRLADVPVDLRRWEWHYLKRASAGGLFTLRGHAREVRSVCFSPDGRRIATGSWDSTVKVWDARTGRELLSLQGHTGGVNSVCFSPDGKRLASASAGHQVDGRWMRDGEVKLWDVSLSTEGRQAGGQEALTIRGHREAVTSVCFSPEGNRLATASTDKTARVWDVSMSTKDRQAGGQEILALKGHTSAVAGVCFSPDGKHLATSSREWNKPGEVKVWDAHTGQEVLCLGRNTSASDNVCFSPDSRYLANGSSQEAKVWDTRTGQEVLTLRGHKGNVTSVCFSPDGQRLATAGSDGTAKVWDVSMSTKDRQAGGKELLPLIGHTSGVWSVAFSPDGQRLVTGSGDNTAKVWDVREGQQFLALKGHTNRVSSLSFSPDNRHLASAGFDRMVCVWDVQTGQRVLALRGHREVVTSVCFSPDGKRLASAGGGGRDAQGKSLPGEVKLWDVQTGQQVLALKGHTDFVTGVCFSPDGKRLASASWDKTVRLWNTETGQEALSLKGHTAPVWSVCFSPLEKGDSRAIGKHLASAGGAELKVWDVETGQQVLALRGHTGPVHSVAFSPDGKRLASASGFPENHVKVWDVETSTKGQQAGGQQVLALVGHTARVWSICFSPDGSQMATASDDEQAVKVWDARTGQELLNLPGHTTGVTSVCFSRDGNRLAGAGDYRQGKGGEVRVWDARPVKPEPDAEELLIRRARTRLDPDWHAEEAAEREKDSQWLAAAFHLEQVLTARAGDPARLLQVLSRAVTQQPELSSTWRRLALAQLQAGQADAQRRTCEQMQQRFRVPGEVAQAGFALAAPPQPFGGVGVALLRHPGLQSGAGLYDRLVTVRTAVLRPQTLTAPESWLAALPREEKLLRGAVLCRAGKHADAVGELAGLQEPVAVLFRALAEHGRGNKDAARQALAEARKQLSPQKVDLVEQTPLPWQQRVESDVLVKEVEALLAAK